MPQAEVSFICDEEGCTKPKFAKQKCAAHYMQIRRGGSTKGTIKEYGQGHNRIQGSVSDKQGQKLQRYADKHFGGSIYAVTTSVMRAFAESLPDEE